MSQLKSKPSPGFCSATAKILTGGATFVVVVFIASAAQATVAISSGQTQDMSCSAGVCSPTATDGVLNVSDLETLLASGNVEVTTTGSGGVQAGTIDVSAALAWSSASTLALDAYQSIAFGKPVSVTGDGGVVLATDDGGSGGTLTFGDKGSLAFENLASALTINGTSYALENSISALAAAIAANPGGAYALANSYDASTNGTYSSSPIPTALTGKVEGLGNTISKLSIANSKKTGGYFALFAMIGPSGTVAGLKLSQIDIRVPGGNEHKASYIAGLAGDNQGTLFNDQAEGKVSSKFMGAGGLVSFNENGAVISSSARVVISGAGGGLVFFNNGSISLSSSSGRVTGGREGNGGGGLVFRNDDIIDQSFATGDVTGGENSYDGGLVALDDGGITNSYATGAVSGGASAYVGGLVGYDDAVDSYSYSTGHVFGGYMSHVGGFSGSEGNAKDCYWDTKTSGTNDGIGGGNGPGVTGLTSRQLKSGLPSGFDPSIWGENPKVNHGFPYLLGNPPEK